MAKVLIVEDNELNRDMLGRRLQRRGYLVRFAVDGASGLAMAEQERPDVILMDIALGDAMDGWEATRRLKSKPETAAIPVIALTANAFETDRQRSLAAGCSDFDTKPVDLPRLLSKIENCLRTAAA